MSIHSCIFNFILLLACTSCNSNTLSVKEQKKNVTQSVLANIEKTNAPIKYLLNAPEFICALDDKLIEISALSYDEKSNSLFAVNDEKAKIYRLNAGDCAITKEYDFGKKGDYEGIEGIGDKIYVLKANGNIYRTAMKDNEVTQQYKTPLNATNDVEGLGYNPLTNELILACKGSAALEEQEKLKATKAFYNFSLSNMSLDTKPAFTITDDALFSFYDKMPAEKKSQSSDKKLRERLKSFSPSAIAWHPIEKRYYILSSVGKSLVVVDNRGGIKTLAFLDNKIHVQPEGICFAPDGTLFISNEGRGLVAKIMRFAYP